MKKTYVLSDLHIGTNEDSCWYYNKIHGPYLEKIFAYILGDASPGDELIKVRGSADLAESCSAV
jgi:hypothetical protein